MAQKISKNTFFKGMNLDSSIENQPGGTYREANELRLSVDKDGTIGTLSNVKGNYKLITGISSYFTMLGSVVLDDYIILLAKYERVDPTPVEFDAIIKLELDGETASSTILWTDEGKSAEDSLNLDSASTIKMVSRKESETIHKIYWVDGNTNYLRYANVAENLTTDGEVKSISNDYVSAKTFGTVSSVTFAEPELQSTGGGGLSVGAVQYAYQLYNKNGSESSFSPATGLYHITSSAESGSNSRTYEGNAIGDSSGKSFSFQIDLSTYEYERIRIVSLHYEYYQQVPTISIVAEVPISSDGTVLFTDTGSGYLGTYTIEQFTALAGLYKATDIASSKNYLFLANITENYFNIGDYDARVYRFNKNATKKFRGIEGNGDYYLVQTDGTWNKYESDGTPISSGSSWSIADNADLINPYNNTLWDNTGRSDTADTYLGNFIYNSAGVLGGTGKNISFVFDTEDMAMDTSPYIFRIYTNQSAEDFDGNDTVGFDGYYSPYNTANRRSYQRGETYRFGVVFFDKYGRESVVKWIADIRMPNIEDYTLSYSSGGTGYAKQLFPKFTVNNYPDGAVSYKIVRVQRDTNDMSVVANGMLRPTAYRSATASNQPYHSGTGLSTPTLKENLQEFISPEISFYKDFSVKNNDYLEIFMFDTNKKFVWDLITQQILTSPTQECVIKMREIDYPGAYYTTSIYDGQVVGPSESDETYTINSITYYGYFDEQGGDEEGYKGTSLILGTTNNGWTYPGTSSKNAAVYAQYRRHVYGAQYGGHLYVQRSNSEYIGCSPIIEIPSNEDPTDASASQGDIFINMMDHTALYYVDYSEDVFLDFIFPVETTINLALRHDDAFYKVYSPGTGNYKDIREEGNTDENLSELYLYNTVYSQENNSKLYFPLPESEDPVDTKEFSTRILVSEKKFNNEESDSWLTFLTNNFIDVDANYGELTNIMDYNNNLLYWQPRAFGMVDVDPRSLITDNNPGALVLGTGAVLSRFDYLSTMTGNTDPFGILKTPKGIYWYDNENSTIVRYQGNSVERLSKLLGTQSFLNTNKFTTSLLSYLPKYDEVLFTLTDGNDSDTTLVFNELVNVFTGFYGFIPQLSIQYKDELITSKAKQYLYLHDSASSAYGNYYLSEYYDSTIKIPINPDVDIVKVFDAINFTSYIYNSSDVLIYDETFDSIRFYNSYQNTDYVTLTPGTNISRKKGIWSLFVPRNAVDKDPSTNPDIFSAANLDQSQTFKPRMRDTYMVMDLIYENTNNYRIKFPFIHTKYRINYR